LDWFVYRAIHESVCNGAVLRRGNRAAFRARQVRSTGLGTGLPLFLHRRRLSAWVLLGRDPAVAQRRSPPMRPGPAALSMAASSDSRSQKQDEGVSDLLMSPRNSDAPKRNQGEPFSCLQNAPFGHGQCRANHVFRAVGPRERFYRAHGNFPDIREVRVLARTRRPPRKCFTRAPQASWKQVKASRDLAVFAVVMQGNARKLFRIRP